MIAVIADDFTGAAEIGGIGLRYGLKVVIATHLEAGETADLLVVPTDTRSLKAEEAAGLTEELTRQILCLEPEFVFKKVDSTLRGNIAREIEAMLKVLGKQMAILVPENPGLGRIVQNGHYYIQGVPINETFFAITPGFPEGSSSVVDIINKGNIPVVSRAIGDELPLEGIIVGDASSQTDLSEWARHIGCDCFLAGGAGFFNTLLAHLLSRQEADRNETLLLRDKSLFVMGSLFPRSEGILSKNGGKGPKRMNMPEEIYKNKEFSENSLEQWADEIIQHLDQADTAIISMDHEPHDEPGLSKRLSQNIGQVVRKIMDKTNLNNILIEGGATTFEILKSLNIIKLYPYKELGLGIIQMKVGAYPGLSITTKPGSYDWPENIKFEKTGKGNTVA